MFEKIYKQDPSFTMKPKYMSANAMSAMYSSKPVVCSDVVLYQKEPKAIFLTTRILTPAKGLWVIGGSRQAGETATDAIVRRMKAETSLLVDPERFKLLGIAEFIWPNRAEPPINEGRHDVNYVFALEVSDDELKTIATNLDPKEYEVKAGLKRFESVSELEAVGARECITDYFKVIFG